MIFGLSMTFDTYPWNLADAGGVFQFSVILCSLQDVSFVYLFIQVIAIIYEIAYRENFVFCDGRLFFLVISAVSVIDAMPFQDLLVGALRASLSLRAVSILY